MALFPIIGLAYFAAVVSLLAAGAGEEGDVGDTAVGAARGHGGHAGESSLTMMEQNRPACRCGLFSVSLRQALHTRRST